MKPPIAPPLPISLRSQGPSGEPRRRKRLLMMLLVLGTLTSSLGVNTLADMNAATTYTGQTFSTAHVQINNNNQNDAASLALSFTNMLPGDTITKTLDVANTGDTDLLAYKLSAAATTSTKLDDGTGTSRLKVWIARCSVAWVAGVCSGIQTDLVGSTAAAPVNITFAATAMTPAGRAFCKSGYAEHVARGNPTCTVTDTDRLQFQASLPSTGAAGSGANNDLQGLTSVISFAFTAQQPTVHNF